MAKSEQNLAITSTISHDRTAGLSHEHDENLASVFDRQTVTERRPQQPGPFDDDFWSISSTSPPKYSRPQEDSTTGLPSARGQIVTTSEEIQSQYEAMVQSLSFFKADRDPIHHRIHSLLVEHLAYIKPVGARPYQTRISKVFDKDAVRNVPGDGSQALTQQQYQIPMQLHEQPRLSNLAMEKRLRKTKPELIHLDEIFAVACPHQEDHALLYRDPPKIRKQPVIHENQRGYRSSDRKSRQTLVRHFAGGHHPIGASLQRYLEREKLISILILRVVECPHTAEPRESDMEQSVCGERDHIELDSKAYLLIVSPAIQEAMAQFAKFSLPKGSTLPLPENLQAPRSVGVIEETMFYFHHFNELQRFIEIVPSQQCETQQDCFSAFAEALRRVTPQWDERCVRVRAMHDNGETTRESIEFLFHPNMPVVARSDDSKGEPIVCIVQSTKANVLSCWSWMYDGKVFFRGEVKLGLDFMYDRPVRIADLDICPLSHANQHMIEGLRIRAETMWRLREQSFIAYSGSDANDDRRYLNERFIIDIATHQRIHKSGGGNRRVELKDEMKLWPNEISLHDRKPEGVALLALPAVVSGFNLQDKKWYLLRVKNIKDIRYNKKAFDRLVLPPDTKELVQALVETQGKVEGAGDVISGKGNGLILLLHGGPGTGKTLTAESVAELAEKPLYRVTCGDIGTDPEAVEKYLNTVLYLGKTWDCIVLLDEADVFLEGRDLNDLARNSLVSVFLRTLEYFEGILILTTNRVGTFDEAFKSRIQVALHYPDLTPKVRRQIWQNLLELIEDDESLDVDVDDILEHIDELKNADLNGRQIRDAINTSRRLALFRKEQMAWRHVSQVVRIVGQFTQYLEKTHKHKDAERARELEWRA